MVRSRTLTLVLLEKLVVTAEAATAAVVLAGLAATVAGAGAGGCRVSPLRGDADEVACLTTTGASLLEELARCTAGEARLEDEPRRFWGVLPLLALLLALPELMLLAAPLLPSWWL